MSAKSKVSIVNVKTVGSAKRSARISNCSCGNNHDHVEHKSCGRRDPAVEGVQEAGKELSQIFKHLKNEEVAERLVRAIRCHDARAVQRIIGCECRVVHFFCTHRSDCVRICCSFGRDRDVTVSFDICIKRREDHRNRRW